MNHCAQADEFGVKIFNMLSVQFSLGFVAIRA